MEPSVPVTLRAAATVAAALYRMRAGLLAAGAAAMLWLGLVIVLPDQASTGALLPLALLLWVGLGLAMAYILPRLPAAIAPGDGLAQRWRKRLGQAAYRAALLTLIVAGAFVALLSWRALPLAMG